jgi:cytidyltransferase-like protein
MKSEKIKIGKKRKGDQSYKPIVGFTAGNFDLIHPGYIYTFEEAKRHCDYFMVFLQKDPSETRYTKYKPVIPLYERYKTLTPKVVYTTRSHGWSTTKLKDMITLQTVKQNPKILNK